MNKENLEKLVSESRNIRELLQKLNITISSNNYNKIRKALDKFKIDYSHFSSTPQTKGIEDISSGNHNLNSQYLKNRLIELNLKENKCEICGQLPFHNGKELVLQLHHVNGNHQDNRIENLQILCPNCHSQTENYCKSHSNKIKESKHYYCPKCGNEMSKNAILCSKCRGEQNRKVKHPTKEQLLQKLIELKGNFTKTGEYYGVTDNAIRKWCKSYQIPHLKTDIKNMINNRDTYKNN